MILKIDIKDFNGKVHNWYSTKGNVKKNGKKI